MTQLNIQEDGNLYIGSETWRELKTRKDSPAFAIVASTLKHFLTQGKAVRVINDVTGGVDRSCDRMSELQDEVGADFPLDKLA
ncbi:hypothetical protein [Herbaspirillum sp. RV1423]|uniref:hypothetical protein n=1 Tax=Herbaspirillum sp. RV1423 TaxID=1443993 RepID=UPI0004B9562B|nr:hypothetical protein [Herbaspirillum sp. RV1423]